MEEEEQVAAEEGGAVSSGERVAVSGAAASQAAASRALAARRSSASESGAAVHASQSRSALRHRWWASLTRVLCLALVFVAVGRVGGRLTHRLRALLSFVARWLQAQRHNPRELMAGAAGALGQAAVMRARRMQRNRPRRQWSYSQLPDMAM